MKAKTYRAETVAAALAEVKRDLGRDAVILKTRDVRTGGLLGLLRRRSVYEITAARQMNAPRREPTGEYVASAPAGAWGGHAGAVEAGPRAALAVVRPGEADGGLAGEISEMHRMLQALVARKPAAAADEAAGLVAARERLAAQEVAEEVVGEVVGSIRLASTGEELADEATVARKLRERVAGRIATTEHLPAAAGRRVIALIGPTGVGKTTTIAKLAANFKLHEGRRVGLVTIDTYRIAAVDQLRTYAEIIEVPLATVLSPAELKQAIRAMQDVDVVLIDTAGRSQNDQLRLNQLRSFLAVLDAHEVHLVVAATGTRSCTRRVLECFAPLGANRIILTKLDEAETFGTILNIAAASDAPFSYVTTGQAVPDDIAPARADWLARRILGGRRDDD
jgi:flagellar biosynthesis protein FlhF